MALSQGQRNRYGCLYSGLQSNLTVSSIRKAAAGCRFPERSSRMDKSNIPPDQLPPVNEKLSRITDIIFYVSNTHRKAVYGKEILKWMEEEARWGIYFYLVCTLYFFLRIGSTIYSSEQNNDSIKLKIHAGDAFFHALIILFGAVCIYIDNWPPPLDATKLPINSSQDREKVKKALKRAADAVEEFFPNWQKVWVSWFLLYLSLAASYYFSSANPENKQDLWFMNVFSNAFNNFTALFLFVMYHVMSEPTVGKKNKKGLGQILSMVLLLIAGAELAISWKFHCNLDLKKANDLLSNTHFGFSVISGVLTGIATTLLTIRFAGRIIGARRLIIFILVIYCIIQPLFPMVLSPEPPIYHIVGQVAITLAIYGKATLLVLIQWTIHTHRLTYYMVRAKEMSEEEDVKRTAFLNELQPENEKVEGEDDQQGKNTLQ